MAAVFTNGVMSAVPLSKMLEQEERRAVDLQQSQPMLTGLSGHVRKCWTYARDAKIQTVEQRMLFSVRARRGEYEPDKLAQIRDQGGSEVYAMLTSVKCRAAGSWIRDVLMGQGSEKPWTIRPTPNPDLPPQIAEQIVQQAAAPIQQAMMTGQPVSDQDIAAMMGPMRDKAMESVREQARQMAQRMESKMEDQLVQGGWLNALDAFIDDITTFPAAIMKGPVVRKKPVLKWTQVGQSYVPEVTEELKLEWTRVDPFMIYPSPAATTVDDGYLIEKHRMSRQDLQDLIGVEGYDDAAIRRVLDEYGRGGLREWLTNDVAQASAQGKSTTSIGINPDSLIDALEFWGPVQGKMLIDWGMDSESVPDPQKDYHVNVWLVGTYVIKATLNYDPMRRKPYYKASYEDVPGAFWGNSVADLVRDAQTVCNASARAIVNNMGIASGPQVVVNVDRLPAGEDITQMTPWKIWQVTNDPLGGNQAPIVFSQPDSRVQELMAVFEKFSMLADEYSGIPRYMAGDVSGTGIGRTASGLSMLMGNAGKSIKQVISNIDNNVLTPMLERLYYYNMRYSNDAELKGDVNVVARGANSLIAKDAAQLRRNEFLAATANPIDMQIIGLPGRAAILRENAKTLDMDPDKIVPPPEVVAAREAAQAQMLIAQQQAQAQAQQGKKPSGSGQNLMDGSPVTDNFSPS
jgi:hypothetical protein